MCKLSRGLIASAATLLVSLVPSYAQTPGGGYGPNMMWGDGGWNMFFFGPLFMILTLAAFVLVIVFLVRWLAGSPAAGPPSLLGKTPLDTLKERFARGEIDKAEFEDRRKILDDQLP